MSNLKNVKFNSEILEGAVKLDYKSSIFDSYRLRDGSTFRMLRDSKDFTSIMLRNIHDDNPDFFFNELRGKLEEASNCGMEGIIPAKEISLDEAGRIKGYLYSLPSLPGLADFNQVLRNNPDNLSTLIKGLYQFMNEAHKQGVHFPSLGISNFIHYDKDSGQFYIAPCDLLQVGDHISYDMSSLLEPTFNSVFVDSDYRTEDRWHVTDNFDNAALYMLMLNTALGMNVPKKLKDEYSRSINGRWNPNPCFINTNPSQAEINSFGRSYRDLLSAVNNFAADAGLAGSKINFDLLRIYCNLSKGGITSLFSRDRVPSPVSAAKKLEKLNIQRQIKW